MNRSSSSPSPARVASADSWKRAAQPVGVVGLGYVGLPLMLGYAAEGFEVCGFDIDESKVSSLRRGESYIQHISSVALTEAVEGKLLSATTDFSKASEMGALIICVPTPLDRHHEPDLSYVIATVDALLPHLVEGQVLSLESTTWPGTTEEILRPKLEEKGFVIGENFYLIYSPEREDPGNEEFAGPSIPKVVGGTTAACLQVGVELYGRVFSQVVPVESTKVAEFSKLLENIYRAVNIGLVNELKVVAQKMDIDIWKVIDAAASKPFGFKAFYPGPGLGGHCIPIDPFYLTWKAKEYGVHTRFIELAGEINKGMPEYVVQRVSEALNECKKPVKGSRILLMGLAYKSDVDDMRESPTFHLMDRLKELGGEVSYFDPHIPEVTPTREHAEWTGQKSIEWSEKEISAFDAVVISTTHSSYNLEELVAWSECIVDTRDALEGIDAAEGKVFKA